MLQAFEDAWNEACKVAASTLLVPSGSTFLVGPVSFLGKECKENIVFQVNFQENKNKITEKCYSSNFSYIVVHLDIVQLDGKIIAPTSSSAWGSGLLQWMEFKSLTGITIKGKGVIDGQGSVWWNKSPDYDTADENDMVILNSISLAKQNWKNLACNNLLYLLICER